MMTEEVRGYISYRKLRNCVLFLFIWNNIFSEIVDNFHNPNDIPPNISNISKFNSYIYSNDMSFASFMAVVSTRIYMLLLSATSSIIFALWLLSMQQLCITKLRDHNRLIRTLLLVLFSTLSILLNGLVYLSTIFPDFKWDTSSTDINITFSMLSNGIEAFVLVIGFHIARIVISSMIHNMYLHTNSQSPNWIKYSLYSVECFVVITIIMCYSFSFIFEDTNRIWRFSFYIVKSLTIIIEDICILIIMKRLLNVLHYVQTENREKVQLAIHSIHIAQFFLWLIMIICAGFILMSLYVLYKFMAIPLNILLMDDILHSLLLIAVLTFFEWWIYLQHNCCIVERNTVCIFCGCGEFWIFYCDSCCKYDKNIQNSFHKLQFKNHKILLQDSINSTSKVTNNEKRTATPLHSSLTVNTFQKREKKTITPLTENTSVIQ